VPPLIVAVVVVLVFVPVTKVSPVGTAHVDVLIVSVFNQSVQSAVNEYVSAGSL
jgi:hypothetical protein